MISARSAAVADVPDAPLGRWATRAEWRHSSDGQVGIRAQSQQLANGTGAPGAHCPEERSGAAPIGNVQLSPALDQCADELRLPRAAPDSARIRPRIAGVVERRGATAIPDVGFSARIQQLQRSFKAHRRRREMEWRVAHVEPVRNGGHESVAPD